jgi:hypothetical protein
MREPARFGGTGSHSARRRIRAEARTAAVHPYVVGATAARRMIATASEPLQRRHELNRARDRCSKPQDEQGWPRSNPTWRLA